MADTRDSLVPLSGKNPIDGLLDRSGWVKEGDKAVLTWSAHNSGGVWTASELAQVRAAFAAWSNVANIEFLELTGGGSFRFSAADIAMTASGGKLMIYEDAVGLAFLPVYDPTPTPLFGQVFSVDEYPHPEGDVFIDNPETGSFNPGSTDFATLLHEIGHALGLKHPHDAPRTFAQLGLLPKDVVQWTVMSYETIPGSTLRVGWPVTPMPYDILAIQYLYGANMEYRTGDDVYTLATDGTYRTLWDAGGVDTLDGSGLMIGTTISLVAGTFTLHGARSATAVAFNVVIENAIGTQGNDVLKGNGAANDLAGGSGNDELNGAGGSDLLRGGTGADLLKGGTGADSLLGNAGNDRFFFDPQDVSVNGGPGLDQLVIIGRGQTLNLVTLDDGRLMELELIDLTGTGNNTLRLDADEVLGISSSTNILRVMGNAGDRVYTGGGWEDAADRSIGGQLYHQFTHDGATLFIDADISVFT